MVTLNHIGIVVIGRNEGDRLRRCLNSVVNKVQHIVYVDSASTDGSLELAREFGVDVVELDPSKPFASPRSRNEGFYYLMKIAPHLKYVQFIDGDCELSEGWLEQAEQTLNERKDVAVVCGRRRELYPEASIYNLLCDIEWNTPVGEARSCGGDSMMRPEAFKQVGGFNPGLIGGGEPELCVRLRRNGWKILRLDAEMSMHDADIHRFQQWWNRNRRVGHAYAEGSWLHGRSEDRHWLKDSWSIWLWGLVLPVVTLLLVWPTQGWSLLLLLGYPLLVAKIYFKALSKLGHRPAIIYALSCVIGKFPLVLGQIQFHLNRLKGRNTRLVEYKDVKPIDA